jgi:hypothetical protein
MMKRTAGVLALLAVAGGCVSTGNPGPYMGDVWKGGQATGSCCASGNCATGSPTTVPGVQGPWGAPVTMAAPYSSAPPTGEQAARDMLAQSLPMNQIQRTNYTRNGASTGGIMPAGGMLPGAVPPPGGISPPGVPGMPGMPPAGGVMQAGMMAPPGGGMPPMGPMMGAPGTGPLAMGTPPVPGAVAAVGAITGPGVSPFPAQRNEVYFTGPLDMKVSWYTGLGNGNAGYSANAIDVPGRYNFLQGAIYRLKLTNIPNRPDMELYPTLEVWPQNAKTCTFLAHSAVPVNFTDEDLEQVAAGNLVVKVIYLPDPNSQSLATTGPDEVVSSRLEPGVDPIAEACRRGSILLVVRVGNIHLELPHSPAMDAPGPHVKAPGMMPGAMAAGPMGPFGAGRGPMLPPGGPMMPPGGPMVTGPNGPMMVPPSGPQTVPASPVSIPMPPPALVPSGPVGRLPDATGVQPAQFKAPATLTPAQLAGQTPPMPPAPLGSMEKRPPEAPRWVIPGMDSGSGKP